MRISGMVTPCPASTGPVFQETAIAPRPPFPRALIRRRQRPRGAQRRRCPCRAWRSTRANIRYADLNPAHQPPGQRLAGPRPGAGPRGHLPAQLCRGRRDRDRLLQGRADQGAVPTPGSPTEVGAIAANSGAALIVTTTERAETIRPHVAQSMPDAMPRLLLTDDARPHRV